jgi:hypothetical protein
MPCDEPIVVYQMGKVGSLTLVALLYCSESKQADFPRSEPKFLRAKNRKRLSQHMSKNAGDMNL